MSTASFHHSTPQIVLTDDQAQTILDAQGAPVELRTASGERIGFASISGQADLGRWSAEDIAIAKERSATGRPGKSTAEMLEHLSSLGRE